MVKNYLPLLMLVLLAASHTSWGKIPRELEPDYSEAIIEFHVGRYAEALTLLNRTLRQNPETIELLELKALALKLLKRPNESAKTYRALIKVGRKNGLPEAELAPYHFELGTIFFQAKKLDGAIKAFRQSASLGFNPGPSQFYLGMSYFQKDRLPQAQKAFERAVDSNQLDLVPPSHLFLAQIFLKTGYINGSTRHFLKARRSAESIVASEESSESSKKVAKKIIETTSKALAPLDRNTLFGNISLSTAYDSNIKSVPDTTADDAVSGKQTLKETLSLTAGYMTSPLNPFQFVPSYHGSINYNFNRDASENEYLNQTLSLYTTYLPLGRYQIGGKVEGVATFNNRKVDDVSKWELIVLGATLGPYAKYEIRPHLLVGLETFVTRNRYLLDKNQEDNAKRSGWNYYVRSFLQNDAGRRWINPTLSIAFNFNNTRGTEFRSKQWTFQASNKIPLSKKLKLSQTLSYKLTRFAAQGGDDFRKDETYDAKLGGSYKFTKHLSGTTDLNYTFNNSSEVTTYEYTRWVFSVGASYSFY